MIPQEVSLENGLMAFQHSDYQKNFSIRIAYPVGDQQKRANALRRFWNEFERHEANFKVAPHLYLNPEKE